MLRTIQEVKDGTYKVKKVGPVGKYWIERALHYKGYKLLLEILAKLNNRELSKWANGRIR